MCCLHASQTAGARKCDLRGRARLLLPHLHSCKWELFCAQGYGTGILIIRSSRALRVWVCRVAYFVMRKRVLRCCCSRVRGAKGQCVLSLTHCDIDNYLLPGYAQGDTSAHSPVQTSKPSPDPKPSKLHRCCGLAHTPSLLFSRTFGTVSCLGPPAGSHVWRLSGRAGVAALCCLDIGQRVS